MNNITKIALVTLVCGLMTTPVQAASKKDTGKDLAFKYAIQTLHERISDANHSTKLAKNEANTGIAQGYDKAHLQYQKNAIERINNDVVIDAKRQFKLNLIAIKQAYKNN